VREPQCHCGVLRSESPAAPAGDEGASGRFVRTVLGLALIAAASYGFYAAAVQRERRQQAAETARLERLRLENAPPSGEKAPPPETTPRTFAPTPYTPPVGGSFGFPSPKPEASPTPAPVKPPAHPDDASPAPTSMEEAWARATEILEPSLQQIAAETAELQQHYAPFASTCLASPDANWLVAMRSGAFVRTGIPYSKFGVITDCEFGRRELVTRANVIKAEVTAAERLAQSRSVLPGHWRKLLEMHQLDVWDAY
jgi:hypothetical protein